MAWLPERWHAGVVKESHITTTMKESTYNADDDLVDEDDVIDWSDYFAKGLSK